MTYVVGVDIGAAFSKAVLLNENDVISHTIIPSGRNYGEIAEKVMQTVLKKAGLTRQDIAFILATGFGAANVDFADQQVNEASCMSRGTWQIFPTIRTLIDIGGQSTKVIKLDKTGKMVDFAVSEKCASGSGRLLQVIARVLGIPLEDIGPLSLQSTKDIKFTTGCAVFIESEAVSRVAEEEKKEDILAGVHAAIATKVASIVRKIKVEADCAVTGGGARDIGLVRSVEEKIACRFLVPDDPQITVALGAAFIAKDKAREGRGDCGDT